MNLSKVYQLSYLTSHAATARRGLIFNKNKTDANEQKIQHNFYWTDYTTAGSQQKSTPKEWLSPFQSEKWINNHINNSAKQQHVLTFTRCLTIRAFETCWARLSAGEKHKQAKKTLSQCAFFCKCWTLVVWNSYDTKSKQDGSKSNVTFLSEFPTRCEFQVDLE